MSQAARSRSATVGLLKESYREGAAGLETDCGGYRGSISPQAAGTAVIRFPGLCRVNSSELIRVESTHSPFGHPACTTSAAIHSACPIHAAPLLSNSPQL